MSRGLRPRERGLWIGTVAVLGTSLAWLGAIDLAWLAHGIAARSVALRAVARAVRHIVWSGLGPAPFLLLVLAGVAAMLVLARALRDGAEPEREVRHV